jgi:hypothetical protein
MSASLQTRRIRRLASTSPSHPASAFAPGHWMHCTVKAYNLVEYGGIYFAIPHSLDAFDLAQIDAGSLPGVIVRDNLIQARDAILVTVPR